MNKIAGPIYIVCPLFGGSIIAACPSFAGLDAEGEEKEPWTYWPVVANGANRIKLYFDYNKL